MAAGALTFSFFLTAEATLIARRVSSQGKGKGREGEKKIGQKGAWFDGDRNPMPKLRSPLAFFLPSSIIWCKEEGKGPGSIHQGIVILGSLASCCPSPFVRRKTMGSYNIRRIQA